VHGLVGRGRIGHLAGRHAGHGRPPQA
jgi:hypothetical protein